MTDILSNNFLCVAYIITNWLNEPQIPKVESIPKTGLSPDWERYPKARAARSADTAQHIIGWKTVFTSDGNL